MRGSRARQQQGDAGEPGPSAQGDAGEPGPPAESDAGEPGPPAEGKPRKRGWLQRKSIWALRRDAAKPHQAWIAWDERDNELSRLPAGEEIHLGGLVLAEAFTPATVSALYKGLADFPNTRGENGKWLSDLTSGRSAAGRAGWNNLGVVRRPGEFGFDNFDPELPDGVDGVWLYLFYPTPSLTLVLATFTLSEAVGDLSDLLRADYHTSAVYIHLNVLGRFGRIRALIPWARPAGRSVWYTVRRAEDQKRRACESLMTTLEVSCWKWMADRFPGRFSAEEIADRPTVRLVLTKKQVPFKRGPRWLMSLGLGFAPSVWRSTQARGWAISLREWPVAGRARITAAARREDAATSPGGDLKGDTNWYLTQRFADEQSSLVARWATGQLLSLYTDRLALLRDRAGKRRRISRTVHDAKALDNFLMRDGLDASTITSDLEDFTKNSGSFFLDAPAYTEDMDEYPDAIRRRRKPDELLPLMRQALEAQAQRLSRDMTATTTNISVSAGLRQAIANTVVQRRLLILTFVALTISVISVIVAIYLGGKVGGSPVHR